MHCQIKQVSCEEIKNLNITPSDFYHWIDDVINHFDTFILPTKTRVPLRASDYFNVMPCVLPSLNRMGLKVVTRSEERRKHGRDNLDADILLYDYESCNLIALMDGSLITTIRTAAIAVHSMLHLADNTDVVAMVGLGNIGTWIGRIMFDQIKGRPVKVKLFKYKDHADRFMSEFQSYSNVAFEVCDTEMRDDDRQTYDSFLEACEKGKNFLLVCDNCGEIVLDKLLLEQIAKRFPHLTLKALRNFNIMVRCASCLE